MRLFKKGIQEDFVIVAISSGLTMDADNNSAMVSLIELCKPSYWELMNPDGYIVFFRSKKIDSRSRAEHFLSKVQDLITTDQKFAEFKVGINEGPVVTEVDWRGRIIFPPIGDAVNMAFKNQKGKNDLQNNCKKKRK